MPMWDKPTPDGDVKRLPVWAQRYIVQFESLVKAQAAALDFLNAKGKTAITWETMYLAGSLPPTATIGFITDDGVVEVSIEQGEVKVRAKDGTLTVYPECSNVIQVKPMRF